MERNAMERLYSASERGLKLATTCEGQSLCEVEPVSGSSDAQTDRNLLESHHGPVAQQDRAAVS